MELIMNSRMKKQQQQQQQSTTFPLASVNIITSTNNHYISQFQRIYRLAIKKELQLQIKDYAPDDKFENVDRETSFQSMVAMYGH